MQESQVNAAQASETELPSPPPVEVRPDPIEVSFRNPIAVRIGLSLAFLTFLLAILLGPFILVWLIVAGTAAAFLYRRSTGQPLSARSGARLGWITGIFTFIIWMVLIAMVTLMISDKTFVDALMIQMQQRGGEATGKQLIAALQSPAELAAVLFQSFIFCGVLPMIGGMIGARLTRRAG